jgi:hypothetical protein
MERSAGGTFSSGVEVCCRCVSGQAPGSEGCDAVACADSTARSKVIERIGTGSRVEHGEWNRPFYGRRSAAVRLEDAQVFMGRVGQ